MSGYKEVEALWLTRIQAVTGFDSQNTSRGKWGILNSGDSNHYAILKPGEHDREMIGFSTRLDTWRTIIQVWQRYVDDGDSLTDLQDRVDDIVTSLDTYPYLGDTGNTVQGAEIVGVREVIQTPDAAPTWLYVELVGETNEETSITFAE